MKVISCLILLLVVGCLGQMANLPAGGESGQEADGTGGTPSPTGVPDPSNWDRPCRRSDLHCIRNFFKDHSHCKTAYGEAKEPVSRFMSNWILSVFNMTVTLVNGLHTGFNRARVGDFYVDRSTDKVVLTIEFNNLGVSTNNTFTSYYRRAREPIITHGYLNLVFPSLTVTATIPEVDNLRLDMADVFGFANTPFVADVDPRLGESSDPGVPIAFSASLTDLQSTTAEILLTAAPYYAAVYIQNIICNFGLELF